MLSLSGGHDARFAEPPDPHLSDGLRQFGKRLGVAVRDAA